MNIPAILSAVVLVGVLTLGTEVANVVSEGDIYVKGLEKLAQAEAIIQPASPDGGAAPATPSVQPEVQPAPTPPPPPPPPPFVGPDPNNPAPQFGPNPPPPFGGQPDNGSQPPSVNQPPVGGQPPPFGGPSSGQPPFFGSGGQGSPSQPFMPRPQFPGPNGPFQGPNNFGGQQGPGPGDFGPSQPPFFNQGGQGPEHEEEFRFKDDDEERGRRDAEMERRMLEQTKFEIQRSIKEAKQMLSGAKRAKVPSNLLDELNQFISKLTEYLRVVSGGGEEAINAAEEYRDSHDILNDIRTRIFAYQALKDLKAMHQRMTKAGNASKIKKLLTPEALSQRLNEVQAAIQRAESIIQSDPEEAQSSIEDARESAQLLEQVIFGIRRLSDAERSFRRSPERLKAVRDALQEAKTLFQSGDLQAMVELIDRITRSLYGSPPSNRVTK